MYSLDVWEKTRNVRQPVQGDPSGGPHGGFKDRREIVS